MSVFFKLEYRFAFIMCMFIYRNLKKFFSLCNNFPTSPVYLIESAFKNNFSMNKNQIEP